jgi:hypothetical protein
MKIIFAIRQNVKLTKGPSAYSQYKLRPKCSSDSHLESLQLLHDSEPVGGRTSVFRPLRRGRLSLKHSELRPDVELFESGVLVAATACKGIFVFIRDSSLCLYFNDILSMLSLIDL